MPVIRGRSTTASLTPATREALRDRLVGELSGDGEPDGPIIFEIPLEQMDKIDVIVVWKEFEGLRSEDRTRIILDAYKDEQDKISLAMGVTYQEALEQHLLPYAVVPMTRRGEASQDVVRQAMLEEGGIALADDRIDLRFPTLAMAEAAHQRLSERLPNGYWSIAATLAALH